MLTLTTPNQTNELTAPGTWAAAGQAANNAAARSAFGDYQARKAANTTRRQKADLALFAQFLSTVGLNAGDFEHDPDAWRPIVWGMVEAFQRWQLSEGYAIGSVNVRLATVKRYAKLAAKAGTLSMDELSHIRDIEGYRRKEALHIDENRHDENITTRREKAKKAVSVSITATQAQTLITRPDNAQGRRDALMMVLMLDHGLRVGEVAILAVTDFDLSQGTLKFYRPKVDKVQTHKLTARALAAARAYFKHDAPAMGNVWLASANRKLGKDAMGTLTTQGLTERAITKRVAALAARIGIPGLSAHDLRHYWATQAAKNTPIDRLMEAGGWNSYAMPLRYIQAGKIANEGVKLE